MFDRIGSGERVLLISGFPQTRLSWNRLIPLLSGKVQAVPADMPGFGDSGLLSVPATTEEYSKAIGFPARFWEAVTTRRMNPLFGIGRRTIGTGHRLPDGPV